MIRANFNMGDVNRAVAAEVERLHAAIIHNLAYVGEMSVKLAREEHERNYTDRTHNLRASVGYVIAEDGSIIREYGFTGKQEGVSEGKQLAAVVAAQTGGLALVVVAGMQYGVYVEKRQYDVVTFTEASARIMANDLFKTMFGIS